MSAYRTLQPKQFFHASDHEFEPGDQVLSVNALTEQGMRKNGVDSFTSVDPSKVYLADSRSEAAGWGKHIYQVEPNTEPEMTGYMSGNNSLHYTAKSATVVKQIHDKRLGPRGYAPRYP